MYTIVSAFISNVNDRNDRSIEDYMHYGKFLLQLPIPKIIFVEKKYVDFFQENSHELTDIIPIEFKVLQFYNEVFNETLSLPFHRNTQKDTKEYMLLMSNKTNFCKKAADVNKFNTEIFVWLDFGINHILSKNENLINLVKPDYKFNDKIRIGGIWNNTIAENVNSFEQINWFFAGGVFGGSKKAIEKFHDLCTQQFIENLEKNRIVWEVNLWYQIYQKHSELFDVYACNHNESLIKNL